MSGTVHQRLVQLLITRMQALGYTIVASDQNYAVLGGKQVPIPPTILRHSPDVLGARSEQPILCVGEAKTPGDLNSRRTREQLADFATLPDCLVIVAVPASVQALFENMLQGEGIARSPRFECMAIPDALLGS